MTRSQKYLLAAALVASLAGLLAAGCEQPMAPDPSANIEKPTWRSFSGHLNRIEFDWIVSHFSEQICTGGQSLVAGSHANFEGNVAHLGKVVGETSAAWDWSQPATGMYSPTGPVTGQSAQVLATPHAFFTDPFATLDPLAPTCGQTVQADGVGEFVSTGGKKKNCVFFHVIGGEVYELAYSIPGDGQEQFIECEITGGTGRFAGAQGHFVVHNVFKFDNLQIGTQPLLQSQILRGGQIRY